MSIDIDLFTDSENGTVDFDSIETFLRENCPYINSVDYDVIGFRTKQRRRMAFV
ncbi:hypothetical protein D3C85_1876910 [compost metagenome]